MDKTRILYVSQEITPFLPETELSTISRQLPQCIHERGKEIRVFMPRYGKINERRHQLHEVIRLSGMNLIINDADHPLIIKVASIPTARMQVYFIDNEEYFHRKSVLTDEDYKLHEDTDERGIFFIKGVLETVKKLGWAPDIIHCQGWMSALMPLYAKKLYGDDPHFSDAKIVFSAFDGEFPSPLDKGFMDKVKFDGLADEDIALLADPTFENLNKLAIQHSDAVIQASADIPAEVSAYIQDTEKPFLNVGTEDNYVPEVDAFYDAVLEGKSVLIEE